MLLSLLLSISLLSSSGPALSADERAIIEAVVKSVDLEPDDTTAVLSDRTMPLSELAHPRAEPNSRDFTSHSGVHFFIADELVDSLRAANRRSVTVKHFLKVKRTKGRPHDLVSRPGLSRDGLSAL